MTTQAQAGNGLHQFPSRRTEKDAKPAMANGTAFFLHELRRHLVPLAFASLLVAALPVTRRLVEGDWNYWDGIWNVLGSAFSAYVVAPLLAITLAASGWARERSLNLLDWLYARPLSSRAIFTLRVAAIAIPVSIWVAIALSLQRVRWADLEHIRPLSSVPLGLPAPATLLIVGIALALGAGLLASALAPTVEWAVRTSVMLVFVAWTIAFALPRVARTAVVLREMNPWAPFLPTVVTCFVSVVAIVLVASAWRAISVAPDDPGRLRRVATIGVVSVLAATVAAAGAIHMPRLAGPEGRFKIWMGSDAALSFAPARGINWRLGPWRNVRPPWQPENVDLVHPIVRSSGERTVLRDVYAVRYGQQEQDGPWVEPSRGVAIMPALYRNGFRDWAQLDRNGDVTEIPMPASQFAQAIGWSPTGTRFAWLFYPKQSPANPHITLRFLILEEDLTLRSHDAGRVSPGFLRAAWIDDRTVFLTVQESEYTDVCCDAWWATLDVESGTFGARQSMTSSMRFAAPALQPLGAAIQSTLPELDGLPAALLVDPHVNNLWTRPSGELPPPELVRIDVHGAALLLPGPELPRNSLQTSFGNLDDGTLVWAVPEQQPHLPLWSGGDSTQIYRLTSFDASPETVCTMPTGRLYGFVGESGPWLVWETERIPWPVGGHRKSVYELWGCNVNTKEGRRLDEWSEFAHPSASITDRGIFTASGWVPLDG